MTDMSNIKEYDQYIKELSEIKDRLLDYKEHQNDPDKFNDLIENISTDYITITLKYITITLKKANL